MRAALSEDQRQYRETIADFSRRCVAPRAETMPADGGVSEELRAEMAAAGLFGLCVPESDGGSGGSLVRLCLALEELAAESVAAAGVCAMQIALVAEPIARFGAPALKDRYLADLIGGRTRGCFAWLEALHRGGDSALETLARPTAGGFTLDGVKVDVAGLAGASFAIVAARRDGADDAELFLVPTTAHGVEVDLAGASATALAGGIGRLILTDVELPEEARLSGEGVLASTLSAGRVAAAAVSLGVSRAAFEEARSALAREAEAGAQSAQSLQFHLADMATELDGARLLTWKAASTAASPRGALHAARAQLFATEAANKLSGLALSVTGAAGLGEGHRAARQFRDARSLEVLLDSRESQKRAVAAAVVDLA